MIFILIILLWILITCLPCYFLYIYLFSVSSIIRGVQLRVILITVTNSVKLLTAQVVGKSNRYLPIKSARSQRIPSLVSLFFSTCLWEPWCHLFGFQQKRHCAVGTRDLTPVKSAHTARIPFPVTPNCGNTRLRYKILMIQFCFAVCWLQRFD